MTLPGNPTRVYFFGAGTSKSAGLLLSSELLPAIYDPQAHGVDLRRSDIPYLAATFRAASDIARRFLDLVLNGAELNSHHLKAAFEVFSECEQNRIGYGGLDHEDVLLAKRSLEWIFGIILNPAYSSSAGTDSYLRFVQWMKTESGWPVIVTTNWDLILDTYVEVVYGLDIIDCGECDPPLEEFLGRFNALGQPAGRAISLYKLNGSLNWLYCPGEAAYFGPLFQPPWNLTVLQLEQKWGTEFHDPADPLPDKLKAGYCSHCGAPLEVRLYTPGKTRDQLPLASRVKKNVLSAVQNCSELVFAGFSCPDEDRDLVLAIGAALRENSAFASGDLTPVVIDVAGLHGPGTRSRFEDALGARVDYRDVGFDQWVESLVTPRDATTQA